MIRDMQRKDRERVLEIIVATAMFTEDEVTIAEELIDSYLGDPQQKDYHIIVILEGGEVKGYLCYGPTPLTVGTYDLYWMAVSPHAQGKGYGRQLVNWLESKVEEEKGRMIIIETSSQVKYEPTRQFYLRLGYQEVARIPDFYKPGDDRVIYTKSFI